MNGYEELRRVAALDPHPVVGARALIDTADLEALLAELDQLRDAYHYRERVASADYPLQVRANSDVSAWIWHELRLGRSGKDVARELFGVVRELEAERVAP